MAACPPSADGEVSGWEGNLPAKLLGRLQPTLDGVLDVGERLLWRIAVAHATRKIGSPREKAAAVLGRKRRDDDRISQWVCHTALTSSMNFTSLRIYTALIGRLEGMVKISRIRGWLIL